jgi:YVTN family beta-propeller protein
LSIRVKPILAALTTLLFLGCSDGSATGSHETAPTATSAAPLPSEVVVGGSPCGITQLEGSVWVSDISSNRVVKIDVATRAVVGTFPVGRAPCWVAGDESGIWVAPSEEEFVQVLDPVTGQVVENVDVASGPADAKVDVGFGTIWATATPDGDVVRIDPQGHRVVARIHVGKEPRSVVVGGGFAWAAVEGSDRVVAIDPSTDSVVHRLRVRTPSAILAATKNVVWVGQLLAERVTKLRTRDGRILRTYRLQSNPGPGEVIDGEVWAPDHLNSELLRFSMTTGHLRRTEVGQYPSAIVRVGDEVWVANFGDGTISIVDVTIP